MCGIAGLAAPSVGDHQEAAVVRMMQDMRRRGPDSEGLERWPAAILGHRRLAILDLSPAGHQPMLSDDRTIGVVFNGCIYNFLDLRRELESRGFAFRSNCDTEVLVHGYRAWGIEALTRRLRGMFAFAVWDDPQRKLSLVRDRLGVKPLVYAAAKGSIAFASTVRAVKAAGQAHTVDPQAVLEFLEFGYVTEARTIFKEAHKVAPGSIVEWQEGQLRETVYWSLPETNPHAAPRFEDAVAETEQRLLEAVRLRLQADVPLCALLSAGVDSSLVCWALAELKANVRAFTVATPGDPSNEAPEAQTTARQLGIDHEIVTLPEAGDEILSELTDAYGEPLGCPSALAMLQVSRAVRPHATVLLTGDGGDDVFLGYRQHLVFWRAQQLANRLPAISRPLWAAVRPLTPPGDTLRRARHLLDYATGGLGEVTRVNDGLPFYWKHNLLGEQLAGRDLVQRQIPSSMAAARRLLWDVLQYDNKTQFPGEFMTKVDGGTMYSSLEARSPFLDHEVWEYAARLPLGLRLHGGRRKAVLREIARRRIGPHVADRKKQGFTVPVERWLAGRWAESLNRLTAGSRLEQEGWIRPGSVAAPLAAAKRNRWIPHQFWFLLLLENWLQAQKEPAPLPVPQGASGSGARVNL